MTHNREHSQTKRLHQSLYLPDLVEQVYSHLPTTLFANILLSLFLVVDLWSVITHSVLIVWISVLWAITIIWFVLWLMYRSRQDDSVKKWANQFRIGVILNGIVWGSSGILLFPESSFLHQVFLILVLGGLIAGVTTSLSAMQSILKVFICLLIIPIVLRFFIIGGGINISVGCMLLIYGGMCTSMSSHVYTTLITSIRLQYENKDEIEERKKTENESRDQHHLLNSLLQDLPLGVIVWGQNKNVIHLNKSFTDITGYSLDDMPHLSKWPNLAYPDPQYRHQVREHWKNAIKHDAVAEYKVHCKSGVIKDIEFRATFLSDFWTINTLTDVTNRNKREKTLRESMETKARSKKMESLGLLAGGVAHDLNNILSGIVSLPQLILLDLPKDDKNREPIKIISESGQKATAIVQDLLTVARGVAIAKEPLNINSVIQNYLNSPDFKHVQGHHPSISIDTSLAENIFNIIGSRVHIRKLLMNLVPNGYEAIENTGRVLISTVNSYIDIPIHGYDDIEKGEYVILSVADQGKGISEEDIERIFEPFYSNKMMGRSGTGLGLAVVWNVVHDHSGYINVLSSSEGTTFNIYFPISRESIPKQKSSLDITKYSGNGESILVVDDIRTQRIITSSIIKKLGYKVATVPSGEAALEYVEKQSVDLILLDMIMDPGMNGRETYEKILQVNPTQKAIIVSGFTESNDIKETLKLGAGHYLKKPLMIQELGIAIKKELEK